VEFSSVPKAASGCATTKSITVDDPNSERSPAPHLPVNNKSIKAACIAKEGEILTAADQSTETAQRLPKINATTRVNTDYSP